MTDARIIEWNATLDGFDMIRPSDPETDADYYFFRTRMREHRILRPDFRGVDGARAEHRDS